MKVAKKIPWMSSDSADAPTVDIGYQVMGHFPALQSHVPGAEPPWLTRDRRRDEK